jgi:FkbM family methyltransferase
VLHPAEDLALLAGLIEAGGNHEVGTCILLQALLEPGDTAVDAGAHVGLLTLAMARAVPPNGRVHAIEPTPRLAELLQRMAIMNNMRDIVTVHGCALGHTEGLAALSMQESMMNSSLVRLERQTNAIEVPVRPLDALLEPGTRPAVVKLDVEGSELDALKGMSRILADSPHAALIVEFGPSHLRRAGTEISDWLGAFACEGFKAWEIADGDGRICPLRSTGLEDVPSLNLLMLRDEPGRWPRLRLQAARPGA